MAQKSVVLIVLGIVTFVVITLAVLFVPYHRSDMTTERLKSLINSKIPAKGSRADVEKFLQENGIQYSSAIGNSNVVNASIHGTSKSLLVEGSIFAVFTFDSSGRLTDAKVTEVYTGP